ncbi:MAG: transposase, partial [Syntrophobacteria bacterium]
MARRPRVHFPGAFYHVIARGNRGQEIFLDKQDYQLYLSFLREYKERYQVLLYAYTLMPNHVHLLIEVSESPLSRLMQSLQFRYTRNFNIKYKKWGHLFQGRYKAILCQKDSYFLELSAYIHLNAVRAGLVKDPAEYQWSSY